MTHLQERPVRSVRETPWSVLNSGIRSGFTWQLAYDKIHKQDIVTALSCVVCAVCQHWQLPKDQSIKETSCYLSTAFF